MPPAIPHIAETATTWQPWLADDDLIWPFVGLGRFYAGQGAFGQSEPWWQGSLQVARECPGDRHPDVATSLNNLALLYKSQGRYEAAEPYYLQALEMRRELLGDRHPDVAGSLWNLGALRYQQGRLNEAQSLLLEALPIYEERIGSDHPNTRNLKSWIDGVQAALNSSDANFQS